MEVGILCLLPISVSGKEIRVGETTVQTLLDEGLNVSWVDEDYNRITIDPSTQLDANSYYTGGSIEVTYNMFFIISLGEAVIARLELHMASEEDKGALEKISFDGVPVTELTREKAGRETRWRAKPALKNSFAIFQVI